MSFKPIEITLPHPSSFDDSMEQFIGQKMDNATLYAIKARAQSRFATMMAMGQIESIPKVYVDKESPHHAVIQTPKYIHDCEECEYLGQYAEADLYFHKGALATLIARFSSEPSDYASVPAWINYDEGCSYDLGRGYIREARRRASEMGLFRRLLEDAP
jgi:hypothetical protein